MLKVRNNPVPRRPSRVFSLKRNMQKLVNARRKLPLSPVAAKRAAQEASPISVRDEMNQHAESVLKTKGGLYMPDFGQRETLRFEEQTDKSLLGVLD